MGERDAEPVDPLLTEVDGMIRHLQESDPEKATGIRDVVIVGTIAHVHRGTMTSLIAALVDKHPELNICHVETMAEIAGMESGERARDILGMIPERDRGMAIVPECSARGWWEQPKSKGERKRERAYNRRLWGKENTF